MKKVIVSVSNDLITDQRVNKVCTTLFNNGFKVLLVGCKKSSDLKPLNRDYNTKRLPLIFTKGFLFYAEFNIRLFFFLLFKKKTILLANDLDILLPNFLISKLQRKKLVFDSHELFSEIPELVNRKSVKNFWLYLERKLIPKINNAYTVCESIADYYNEKYQTKFKVVRNLPVKTSIEKGVLKFSTDKKIIIYQGAINVGRGLELMIETMPFLEGYLFLIVGDGDVLDKINKKVVDLELKDKVIFYGKVAPKELKKITPNAVLGISIEEDLGLNYRYALPNKIFDYIQAGIPIVTSDLPEMKKIVLGYGVGEIVEIREPKEMAYLIQKMSDRNYKEQIEKAKKVLVWKEDEKVLLKVFHSL